MKPIMRVVAVVFPILYCGYLIYYFLHLSGSVEEAEEIGLGPTILGLAIVGLLFCIPLIIALFRIFARPRSRRSDDPPRDDDGGFDADAVVARYVSQRSAEVDPNSAGVPPRGGSGGPAQRTGFGRRIR